MAKKVPFKEFGYTIRYWSCGKPVTVEHRVYAQELDDETFEDETTGEKAVQVDFYMTDEDGGALGHYRGNYRIMHYDNDQLLSSSICNILIANNHRAYVLWLLSQYVNGE